MTSEEQRRAEYVAQQRRQAKARAARERATHGQSAARRDLQQNWRSLLPGPAGDPLPQPPDQP